MTEEIQVLIDKLSWSKGLSLEEKDEIWSYI